MALISRSAALVAGVLSLAAATPAPAASPVTQNFLVNVIPNVDFLDRSSRFAMKSAKSAKLRDFAFAMARDQTLAANALYDWTEADKHPSLTPAVAARLDTAPTSSVAPKAISNSPPPNAAPVWTLPQPAQGKSADTRLPLGQEDLDSLEGLEGDAFDAEFKDKQADALAQVETDYADYAATGDDPALKALATRELPKVKRRRAQLGKLRR